jgi:hypothetical protein
MSKTIWATSNTRHLARFFLHRSSDRLPLDIPTISGASKTMRRLYPVAGAAVAALLLFSYVTEARSPQTESDLTSHRYYENIDRHKVHSPSRTYSGQRPSDASATCADGTYSFSEHASGTCSHHGGVAR